MMQQNEKFAEVEPLASRYARKIVTRTNIFLDDWSHMLLSLIVTLSAIGGGYFVSGLGGGPADLKSRTTIFIGVGGLTVSCIFYFFFDRVNPSYLPNARLRRIAGHSLKCRSDKIVDPDDPKAIFVAEIPRRRWNDPTLAGAADVGFLKVDQENGLLLFEGDRSRYRIPAQCILGSKQEYSLKYDSWVTTSGTTSYTERRFFFVVVTAKLESGTCEAPFRVMTGKGFFGMEQQGAATLELLHEINELQRACSSATES